MSTWIEITDPDDIEFYKDDINILYSSDENGNNYIFFKKALIEKLIKQRKIKLKEPF